MVCIYVFVILALSFLLYSISIFGLLLNAIVIMGQPKLSFSGWGKKNSGALIGEEAF